MAKKTDRNSYDRGFRWGKRTILKEYREDGDRGLHRCDKAAKTCRKYGYDMRITKTKKGVPLTASARQYYRGIADGMQDGYDKL